MDLNHRPLGYEPNELPDCSTPHLYVTTPLSMGRRGDQSLAPGVFDESDSSRRGSETAFVPIRSHFPRETDPLLRVTRRSSSQCNGVPGLCDTTAPPDSRRGHPAARHQLA